MANYDKYSWFKSQRETLTSLLNQSSEVVKELQMDQYSDQLRHLGDKLESDTFKLQVVGNFKNGKSTFINALLGEEILPAYSIPCTAVINEVKYGEEKRAILHFRKELPEKLPDSIPEKALAHMREHNMQDISPIEIPYDEIEQYVVIPMGDDPEQSLLESPYEKVELFYPCPLLKEGVEIIDSPGLNEDETRTRVTMDYLVKADAILMVLNATALCSQTEMSFVKETLAEQGFEDPFFIVNRWDLIPEKEREMCRKFSEQKLSEYSENPIYYVSAFEGLKSKLDDNDALYEKSGVKTFETALQTYLTVSKGKVKLTQPARELANILTNEALKKVIPAERSMLSSSFEEIRARYDNAKPQLSLLREQKSQICSKMELRIAQTETELRRITLAQFNKIVDLVPGLIEGIKPVTNFGIIPSKSKAEIIVKEILDNLTPRLEEEMNDWRNKILIPFIEDRTASIFEQQEGNIQQLLNDLDQINVEISGQRSIEPTNVPTWERIGCVVGGMLIGDVGLAFSGGVNGFGKELVKTAAFEIGAGFLLGVLGFLNPITLFAVILSGGIWNVIKSASNGMKKLKSELCKQITTEISNNADANSSEIAEHICEKLKAVTEKITVAIDTQIKEAEARVESIMKEMQEGQNAIERRKAMLSENETKLLQITSTLQEVVIDLANNH